MPDAVDLDVETVRLQRSWREWCFSVISVGSVPRYSGVGSALQFAAEFVSELRDEALGGPGAGFAEGADGPAGDVVGDGLERVGVALHAAAGEQAVGDFLHPERAFAAGGALAAALVGVKFVDVIERPDHVAGVVQDDDAAGAGHRADGGEGIEIHWDVLEADLAFGHRAVGLFLLDLVTLGGAQHLGGRAAGDDGLDLAARLEAAADIVDQFAHGERADLDFEIAGLLHIAADAEDAGAGVIRAADLGVLRAAHADDVLHVAERLDVIDDGGALVEAEHGGEIGRLDARDRRACLRATRSGRSPRRKCRRRRRDGRRFRDRTRSRGCSCRGSPCARASASGFLEDFRAFGKLAADVDIGEVRLDREAGDDHPLDELMRILMDDVAVLEGAGLGFVRVANEVGRLRAAGLDEAPLDAAGESRAAAAAQAGGLDLVDDIGGLHREAFFRSS